MKGISPLIAGVLLIAFTMAIAALVGVFGTTFSKGETEKISSSAQCVGALQLDPLSLKFAKLTKSISGRITNYGKGALEDFIITIYYLDSTTLTKNITKTIVAGSSSAFNIYTGISTIPEKVSAFAENCGHSYSATLKFSTDKIFEGNFIGYNQIGADIDRAVQNQINGNRWITPDASGQLSVHSIFVYIDNISLPTNDEFQVSIYTDDNSTVSEGTPDTLLTNSGRQIIMQKGWNEIPITATLNPNTAYWFFYNTNGTWISNDTLRFDRNLPTERTAYYAQAFGTWPNTFTPNGYVTDRYSYYIPYMVV